MNNLVNWILLQIYDEYDGRKASRNDDSFFLDNFLIDDYDDGGVYA